MTTEVDAFITFALNIFIFFFLVFRVACYRRKISPHFMLIPSLLLTISIWMFSHYWLENGNICEWNSEECGVHCCDVWTRRTQWIMVKNICFMNKVKYEVHMDEMPSHIQYLGMAFGFYIWNLNRLCASIVEC